MSRASKVFKNIFEIICALGVLACVYTGDTGSATDFIVLGIGSKVTAIECMLEEKQNR